MVVLIKPVLLMFGVGSTDHIGLKERFPHLIVNVGEMRWRRKTVPFAQMKGEAWFNGDGEVVTRDIRTGRTITLFEEGLVPVVQILDQELGVTKKNFYACLICLKTTGQAVDKYKVRCRECGVTWNFPQNARRQVRIR